MVDLKSLFKHLLFSFVSLLLVSCSIEWFEDAETVFNKGLTTPITFYADNEVDEPKVVKEYVLGNSVEASKFPSSSDFEELKSKNGYKLDGYKWMSCTEASIIDKTVLKPEEEKAIVPDCVKIDEKTGLVSSIKITGEICYFYGIWSLRNDIPYSVSHMLQDAENTDEYKLDKTEKFIGTAFAVTDVKPLEYEGFDHLEINQEEINPDGKTVVTVYYNRKKVTVKIYDSDDPASGYKSVTGLYGQKIDVKQPDIPNYFFVSWYYYDNAGNRINVEKIETLPPEDRIYYGSWLQESELKINYFDFGGKKFSGAAGSYTEIYHYGDEFKFKDPVFDSSLITVDGKAVNEVLFDGLYADSDCTKNIKDLIVIDVVDTETASITLYAKWKYKYVYIDCTASDDTERGFSPDKPVASVQEAKKYFDGSVCTTLYAVTPILVGNDQNEPDGITKDYGVTVKRYKSNLTGAVMKFGNCKSDLVVSGVTVDGGSSDGIECSAPAVTVQIGNKVTFTDGFIIQNNKSSLGYDMDISGKTVSLSGAVYLGRVLFFNSGTDALKLEGSVSVPTGVSSSTVATIKLNSYPSTADDKVLALESADPALIQANYTFFDVEDSNCKINEDGYIVYTKESSGGSIVNPLNSKITFKAFDISQVHAGDVIRITAVLNDSAEVKLTDWDYALYFMNAEEIDITSSVVNNESYIELTVGSVAAGSYTLYVSGVYNGVAQDGMFTFVVQ